MFYNLKRHLRRAASSIYRFTDTQKPEYSQQFTGPCPCCGGSDLFQKDILWDQLVDIWGLSIEEKLYINRQQGFRCNTCGSRLRSMAIAAWLCKNFKTDQPLSHIDKSAHANSATILEINEAGQLTQFLKKLAGHTLGCYPDVDIMKMPYADDSFDLVIHSDTLEHIPDPVLALKECKRVLRPGGQCVFTVPMIVNRLSRSTARGLKSYHGHAETTAEDFRVQTEFGADTWKMAIHAGFSECSIFTIEFPAAIVHICKK
jgi:SAM-dependent methyltransferase